MAVVTVMVVLAAALWWWRRQTDRTLTAPTRNFILTPNLAAPAQDVQALQSEIGTISEGARPFRRQGCAEDESGVNAYCCCSSKIPHAPTALAGHHDSVKTGTDSSGSGASPLTFHR